MASGSSEIKVIRIILVAIGHPGIKHTPLFQAETLTIGISFLERFSNDESFGEHLKHQKSY